MSAADFLASIGAKFATREEHAAAVKAVGEIMGERDAARALLREAGEVLRIWDEAHETGRSEPLFIARDAARAFLDKLGSNND